MPGFRDLRIVQVVPQTQMTANVVFDRLQRLGAIFDHFSRHVAEHRQDFFDIEIALIGPLGEGDIFFFREIERSGEEQQIPQSVCPDKPLRKA